MEGSKSFENLALPSGSLLCQSNSFDISPAKTFELLTSKAPEAVPWHSSKDGGVSFQEAGRQNGSFDSGRLCFGPSTWEEPVGFNHPIASCHCLDLFCHSTPFWLLLFLFFVFSRTCFTTIFFYFIFSLFLAFVKHGFNMMIPPQSIRKELSCFTLCIGSKTSFKTDGVLLKLVESSRQTNYSQTISRTQVIHHICPYSLMFYVKRTTDTTASADTVI